MKRKLFTLLLAFMGLTASAQSLLVGDANQDGELSIADVTKTVNMILGREAQAIPPIRATGAYSTGAPTGIVTVPLSH